MKSSTSSTLQHVGQLARYDAMIWAIRECHQVDEVKDIRDKALALQAYHQQANNIEAERLAIEIRIRAERKAGELIKEIELHKGGRPSENHSGEARGLKLSEVGISYDQSSTWQQLADIPEQSLSALLIG